VCGGKKCGSCMVAGGRRRVAGLAPAVSGDAGARQAGRWRASRTSNMGENVPPVHPGTGWYMAAGVLCRWQCAGKSGGGGA